ncbi:MAG: TSUP family transporter, partial [bacterium]
MTGVEMLEVGVVGVGAGFLGGLAGVGGSRLILPALGLILGYPDAKGTQHLYIAAAMTTNLVVAVPAALRHARAGAVRVDLLRVIIPALVVALVVGVVLSNRLAGWELVLALAGFQLSYCGWSLWLVGHRWPDFELGLEGARLPWVVGSAVVWGLLGGVLGLGGGVLL